MTDNLQKLKLKLAEMFQLDQSDLDFGIYRILNMKRDEILRFLDEDLLPQVREILDTAKASGDEVKFSDIKKQAIKTFGEEAINPDGSLSEMFASTPLGQQYEEAFAASKVKGDSGSLEDEVLSHLASFFSRYYKEGDFISLRRYKEGVYSIPYEGEEVKLYWANHDQYYIKSGEYFKDFVFKLDDGRKVHFKLVEASTEKDNVKEASDKERRFIYQNSFEISEDGQELYLHFIYQPPENKKDSQKNLNEAACENILADSELKTWLAELATPAPTDKNKERTLLEKYLNAYSSRNTFDYFIHKELKGFLDRELDFYIKNEVLHLDDVENANSEQYDRLLNIVKAVRRIAHKIIRFLAQLEDFQKKLWLKKKFVYEANYCITLDRVPEQFYPEIIRNLQQWHEWEKLGFLTTKCDDQFSLEYTKKPVTSLIVTFPDIQYPFCIYLDNPNELVIMNNHGMKEWKPNTPRVISRQITEKDFLSFHPYLVLDTALFDDEFKNRLLASFENLDEQCDGLLVHAENFQALNLMQKEYRNKIQCIHIDPPYNTATSGFLYKNSYQHSSWLTMMKERVHSAVKLLSERGVFQCHIDENEYEILNIMFQGTGLPDCSTMIWDKKNPMLGRKGLATQHEYIIWRSMTDAPICINNKNIRLILQNAKKFIAESGGVNEESRKKFSHWIARQSGLSGGEKAYRFLDDEGNVYQSVGMAAPEKRTNPKFYIPLTHPITEKKCPVPPNGWSRAPETIQEMLKRDEILFGADETVQPRRKLLLKADTKRQMSTIQADGKSGKAFLSALGLEFSYCHPVSLYEVLFATTFIDDSGIVLDFFAGSGTTGQAVINLNREDNGKRKFILVEMGDYFNSVTKPRIQKVIYSQDWKDGKPKVESRIKAKHIVESSEKRMKNNVNSDDLLLEFSTQYKGTVVEDNPDWDERNPLKGISHCFKYIRLESYEDALDNLELKRDDVKDSLLSGNDGLREEYMLGYMLDVESAGSTSLLNIDKFSDPFNYKLKIRQDNELKETTVDLLETFNWLIGLRVSHIDLPQRFTAEFEKDEYGKLQIKDRLKLQSDGQWTIRKVEGIAPDGKRVLILWRNLTGNILEDNAVLDAWFEKNALSTRDTEFDIVYVNGDNNLPNLRREDQSWKVRLLEEEFHKRMWEDKE